MLPETPQQRWMAQWRAAGAALRAQRASELAALSDGQLRQAGRLDAELIIEELAPLLDLKGTTEDLTRLERLLASARAPE